MRQYMDVLGLFTPIACLSTPRESGNLLNHGGVRNERSRSAKSSDTRE